MSHPCPYACSDMLCPFLNCLLNHKKPRAAAYLRHMGPMRGGELPPDEAGQPSGPPAQALPRPDLLCGSPDGPGRCPSRARHPVRSSHGTSSSSAAWRPTARPALGSRCARAPSPTRRCTADPPVRRRLADPGAALGLSATSSRSTTTGRPTSRPGRPPHADHGPVRATTPSPYRELDLLSPRHLGLRPPGPTLRLHQRWHLHSGHPPARRLGPHLQAARLLLGAPWEPFEARFGAHIVSHTLAAPALTAASPSALPAAPMDGGLPSCAPSRTSSWTTWPPS